MKITFDEDMQDYISRMLSVDIEEIYLDSDSLEIRTEFVHFIRDLIDARTWSLVKNPYVYDANTKRLSILNNDPQYESDLIWKMKYLYDKFNEENPDDEAD